MSDWTLEKARELLAHDPPTPVPPCSAPLRVSDKHGLCIVDARGHVVADGDPDSSAPGWTASASDFSALVRRFNAYPSLFDACRWLVGEVERLSGKGDR